MKFYTTKTPKLVKWLAPSLIWEFSVSEKIIYLTFDDGPIPEITPWILDQLATFQAKATFFCIGDNVKKHPEIFNQIRKEGHAIGNHTFHHLNAWKVSKKTYLEDILQTKEIMQKQASEALNSTKLFRPPYGKITPQLSKKLRDLGYAIIMWDVLSADFDATIRAEKCLNNVYKHTVPGSIIVFHDSIKAQDKVHYMLPKVLKHFSELGYTFAKITV